MSGSCAWRLAGASQVTGWRDFPAIAANESTRWTPTDAIFQRRYVPAGQQAVGERWVDECSARTRGLLGTEVRKVEYTPTRPRPLSARNLTIHHCRAAL